MTFSSHEALFIAAASHCVHIPHVSRPLGGTVQCFICAAHLHYFRLMAKIMSEVTESSHTDEQHGSTMSETCRQVEATAACTTYLIKQRLPLLRQGKRKKSK